MSFDRTLWGFLHGFTEFGTKGSILAKLALMRGGVQP